MPALTKQEAFDRASARVGASASIDTVIKEADKILNYVNGTTGATTASVAKPHDPRKKPAVFYMVEYDNKNSTGTHLGKKLYDTYAGADRNRTSRRGTLAARFKRVVTLREVV